MWNITIPIPTHNFLIWHHRGRQHWNCPFDEPQSSQTLAYGFTAVQILSTSTKSYPPHNIPKYDGNAFPSQSTLLRFIIIYNTIWWCLKDATGQFVQRARDSYSISSFIRELKSVRSRRGVIFFCHSSNRNALLFICGDRARNKLQLESCIYIVSIKRYWKWKR